MIGAYDGNSWVWLVETPDARELDGYRAIVAQEGDAWWWAALDGNGTGSYGRVEPGILVDGMLRAKQCAQVATRTVAPFLVRGFLR